VTDRLHALFAFLPVGLDRLAHAAMPRLGERSAVVPVAIGLLLLAGIPSLTAGFSLVTTRTIPSEVIDRQVGGVTLLEVVGQAYDTGLPAGTDARGRPLRWLAARDDATQRGMFMIRTPSSTDTLRTRSMTARVAVDPSLVAAAAEALAQRGAAPAPDELAGRYLVEAPGAMNPRDVSDPDELETMAGGTVVRIELELEGVGIAACTMDESCDARAVSSGSGSWLQRAAVVGAEKRVFVTTAYPPTAIPIDLVGRQVLDQPAVQDLAATPGADALLGWGRVFDIAVLDHDPELPVDRSWLAIGVLAVSGLALLIARRRPYPVFRHEGRPAGWSNNAGSGADARATGRITLPSGQPLSVLDAAARVEAADGRRAAAVVLDLPDGEQRLEVPQAATGVRGMEVGRLAWVSESRASLWLHWYQTELQLAFADTADRNRAASLLAGITAPAPPRAAPPPPAPPPRRPATPVADEDPPPEWRRPRPRGAR
jgi:hypothetical protein